MVVMTLGAGVESTLWTERVLGSELSMETWLAAAGEDGIRLQLKL